MKHSLIRRGLLIPIFGLLIGGFLSSTVYAQHTIGGPYEPDSNTVLLMHFDGDFSNAADHMEMPAPEVYGSLSLLEMNGAGALGKQVHFVNDSPDDKSHIQIPDTAALDLTGSWTIEMWVNMLTIGEFYEWNDAPSLVQKPVVDTTNQGGIMTSNYYLDITPRKFNTGYFSRPDSTLHNISSEENLLRIGEWYHITFIRDTAKKLLVQLIHQNAVEKGRLPSANNDSLELVYVKSMNYEKSGPEKPLTGDYPLFIGGIPGDEENRPDMYEGFMDELRISNVARDYKAPPTIDSVSRHFPHKPVDTPIKAKVINIGSNQIDQVTLHYRKGDMNSNFESWQRKQMQPTGSNKYKATISKQRVGSIIEYFIEARNRSGLSTTKPHRAMQDSNYYNYVVWDDSTTILEMDFEGFKNGETPRDDSHFSNPFTVYGGEARYGSGVEQDDQALKIPTDNPYYIQTRSPFLHFRKFTLSLQFIADGGLPEPGTHLISKRTGRKGKTNFEVWIDTNGVVVPDANIVNAENQSRLGPNLRMKDAPIQPDQWYELKYRFSTIGDTAFAKLRRVEDDQTIAETGTKVTGIPYRGSGPLLIGTGDPETDRYWIGRIDDIHLKNYCLTLGHLYNPCVSEKIIKIPESEDLPNEFILHPNHPNPFNPTTQIKYSLPQASKVQLTVYDMLGRRVTSLVDGKRRAGKHSVTFDASNLSSGMYIYRLKAGEYRESKKMLLVK